MQYSVDRLERAIAINPVIAWRLMVMTQLGREVPALPADILFSDIKILVLGGIGQGKRMQKRQPCCLKRFGWLPVSVATPTANMIRHPDTN